MWTKVTDHNYVHIMALNAVELGTKNGVSIKSIIHYSIYSPAQPGATQTTLVWLTLVAIAADMYVLKVSSSTFTS